MNGVTIWKPAVALGLLVSAALLAAHPGHEFHVEGTISVEAKKVKLKAVANCSMGDQSSSAVKNVTWSFR